MSGFRDKVSDLSQVSVDEKFALIDELWESIRRSGDVETRADHLEELEKRVAAVNEDPSIALSASQARALLRK